TATVTITAAPGGSYTGSTTVNFTIAPANLSTATVTLAGGPYTYTGSQIKPAVTVTLGGATLAEGTDYTVTYGTTNIEAGTNIGSVTINPGPGDNFTGTQTVRFTIAQAVPTLALAASPPGGLPALPGTVTLTATLTGPDVAGKAISFSVNGVTRGTSLTDTSGAATFGFTPPAGGNYSFGASFAGDTNSRSALAAGISGYIVGAGGAVPATVPVPALNPAALALLTLMLAGLALRRRKNY
ncbi:MAG: IPTL-CTERM sorting domain-containing protein, partial [Burkholderiaceae bacterium]|nr:IPTL-CTERM sorting domain-containing protein [Burkholderiaceae bacterium]